MSTRPSPPTQRAREASVSIAGAGSVSGLTKDHRVLLRVIEAKGLAPDHTDTHCLIRIDNNLTTQVIGWLHFLTGCQEIWQVVSDIRRRPRRFGKVRRHFMMKSTSFHWMRTSRNSMVRVHDWIVIGSWFFFYLLFVIIRQIWIKNKKNKSSQ